MATRESKTAYPQTPWDEVAISNLAFSDVRNLHADITWACVVYSMVPYLGILFVPLALAVSSVGFVRARRRPSHERYQLLLLSGLSVVILAIQVFLWWLLYFIPKTGV
ncbi:MAG: hypothetical protein ABI857_09540 [Acidobacteriota bacterium]